MRDLLEAHFNLIKKVENSISASKANQKLFEESINPIINKLIISFEQLDYYYGLWSRPYTLTEEQIEAIKRENGERVNEVLKSNFVGTMSHIEFRSRQIIEGLEEHYLKDSIHRKERLFDEFILTFNELEKEVQNSLRSFKNKLKDAPPFDSFSRIIINSNKQNIVTEEEYVFWEFLIKARNTIVHNNAIGSLDAQITFGDKTYRIVKGEMMQGTLYYFVDLLEKAIELFTNWLHKMLPPQK